MPPEKETGIYKVRQGRLFEGRIDDIPPLLNKKKP
jgi:hypothetical protein